MALDLTLTRRDFVSFVAVSAFAAISAPMILRGGLPESSTLPPADLPTVPDPDPVPWARLGAPLTLPTVLVAGRTYWAVVDDVDSPLGVPHGIAQEFVATAAVPVVALTLQNLTQKLVPVLTNARLYADANTP